MASRKRRSQTITIRVDHDEYEVFQKALYQSGHRSISDMVRVLVNQACVPGGGDQGHPTVKRQLEYLEERVEQMQMKLQALSVE